MERRTQGDEPDLQLTEAEKARIEALNGLRQFDAAMAWVDRVVNGGEPFELNSVRICELNRFATEGVSPTAGMYRTCPVTITNTTHTPPGAGEAPGHVEAMCDYVKEHWTCATPIHLAAYLLWHLNWIHPFSDGNGRTSRMISYVVLCVRLGFRLPGTMTIPEQIARDKQPYYAALDAADAAYALGSIDMTVMETYLSGLLANQLLAIHQVATHA